MKNINENTIFIRRSIRTFIKEKKVESEKIDILLRAAMQAPSACNKQPWEYLVIDDEKIIDSIAPIDKHFVLAAKAPLVIIVLGNEKTSYRSENDLAWYPQDLSASIQNILLQATELGLGSVWIGTYPDEVRINGLKKHFNMPEHITPFAVIAIGYSNDNHKFIDRYDSSKVHYNNFIRL